MNNLHLKRRTLIALFVIFSVLALQALPPRLEQNSTPKALRTPPERQVQTKDKNNASASEIKKAESLPDPKLSPFDLNFHRLAVRRLIFSENIKLCEFVPSEIVALPSMHPIFALSDTNEAKPNEALKLKIEKGKLQTDSSKKEFSMYVGNANPYASYELHIDKLSPPKDDANEVGIELSKFGLRDKVQVFIKTSASESGIFFRTFKDAHLVKEENFSEQIPSAPFTLRVQLYGRSLGVFITKDNETQYLGHVNDKEHFGDILDLRDIQICAQSTFNIFSNQRAPVLISGAKSTLSSGIGQADIRLVSNEDLSPYFDENGRIYFTFSARGISTSQSFQGILSLDPSVFDLRMEGAIVFDHEDGLLRNDYASHLFYDRTQNEWRAYVCDFGGSHKLDRRSKTGLIRAYSKKSPLKGFSVMQAKRIEEDSIEGHNEDPCIFFDSKANKWRLLTSAFANGDIVSRTYESDSWDGKFTQVAAPISLNSTGTSIQKIGEKHYAFMGGKGNLRIHSYPDLQELGELKLDLQPHWPKPASRVWASIVPLPKGYPYRYILLTMDRPNFPKIKGANWSYGALYLYGANPQNISANEYEF